MACMEHYCNECGWSTMNNTPYMVCPECGSSCQSYFDEADDHHDEDYDEQD